jgi:nitrite reductase (NO-forming)
MTLDIVATGAEATEHDHAASGAAESDAAGNAVLDPAAEPGDDFEARDAVLPPLPATEGPATHRETFTVSEQIAQVAPGVRQSLWTFNGTAPGPTLHGRVGDRFEISLVNDGTIGHSIDFHAGALAPDEPMRPIQPGERRASMSWARSSTRRGRRAPTCSIRQPARMAARRRSR